MNVGYYLHSAEATYVRWLLLKHSRGYRPIRWLLLIKLVHMQTMYLTH